LPKSLFPHPIHVPVSPIAKSLGLEESMGLVFLLVGSRYLRLRDGCRWCPGFAFSTTVGTTAMVDPEIGTWRGMTPTTQPNGEPFLASPS
jgi:hypothetical protein